MKTARRIAKILRALLPLGLALAAPAARAATTWYVAPAPTGNDSNSGTTLTLPFATLQTAINASSPGDDVLALGGTYTGLGNVNVTFSGKAITVHSLNGPAATIIDGQSVAGNRGFLFASLETNASILQGFTIENCAGPATLTDFNRSRGGGIYCSNSSPAIDNCIFINDVAIGSQFGTLGTGQGWGGGIYCVTSSPAITNCQFSGCKAQGGDAGFSMTNGAYGSGGALFASDGSYPTLSNCVIQSCTAQGGSGTMGGEGRGGAVGLIGTILGSSGPTASCSISGCVFSLNQTTGGAGTPTGIGYGGAIYCDSFASLSIADTEVGSNTANGGGGAGIWFSGLSSPSSIISRTLIDANVAAVAGNGGGILIGAGIMQITNVTLSGNQASTTGAGGGGIYMGGGTCTVQSVTIASNTASSLNGGGIKRAGGTVIITNSIIAYSGASANVSGFLTTGGHNICGDNSGTGSFTAPTDLNNVNPLLSALANNGGPTKTRAIAPPSPAVDSGDNASAPATDQRGQPRPAYGGTSLTTDRGAYEYVAPPTPTPSPSASPSPSVSPSPTDSPTPTPTSTATLTPSFTPTISLTPTPTLTLSPTPSPSPSISPTVSLSPTPNAATGWETYE